LPDGLEREGVGVLRRDGPPRSAVRRGARRLRRRRGGRDAGHGGPRRVPRGRTLSRQRGHRGSSRGPGRLRRAAEADPARADPGAEAPGPGPHRGRRVLRAAARGRGGQAGGRRRGGGGGGGGGAPPLIVPARTAGSDTDPSGISLFLVDRVARGVTVKEYRTIDELRAADVWLSDVAVGRDALLGGEGQALPVIGEVADYATALLCAEAVGAIRYAN